MEYAATAPAVVTTDAQGFLAKVFGWMFLGALALYLDFINLFLYMLRIFGQSR